MGAKFEPKELEIYKKIDDILYFEWNPIGVEELPRDEYYFYLPEIYSLKKAGTVSEIIAQTLYKFETDRMGLEGDIKKCRIVAKKIESL